MQYAIEKTVTETTQAVDWLVAQRFLLGDARPYAGRIFRLNPDRREAARRLVRRAAGRAPKER